MKNLSKTYLALMTFFTLSFNYSAFAQIKHVCREGRFIINTKNLTIPPYYDSKFTTEANVVYDFKMEYDYDGDWDNIKNQKFTASVKNEEEKEILKTDDGEEVYLTEWFTGDYFTDFKLRAKTNQNGQNYFYWHTIAGSYAYEIFELFLIPDTGYVYDMNYFGIGTGSNLKNVNRPGHLKIVEQRNCIDKEIDEKAETDNLVYIQLNGNSDTELSIVCKDDSNPNYSAADSRTVNLNYCVALDMDKKEISAVYDSDCETPFSKTYAPYVPGKFRSRIDSDAFEQMVNGDWRLKMSRSLGDEHGSSVSLHINKFLFESGSKKTHVNTDVVYSGSFMSGGSFYGCEGKTKVSTTRVKK